MRTYTDLIQLPTFQERLDYLMVHGKVGHDTFGYDRYLNQYLYQQSNEWRKVREHCILRDHACDLAHPDYEIFPHGHEVVILVHHMNPITKDDLLNRSDIVFDPEFLITTCRNTHQIIHYGYKHNDIRREPITRTPFDTCPWRK